MIQIQFVFAKRYKNLAIASNKKNERSKNEILFTYCGPPVRQAGWLSPPTAAERRRRCLTGHFYQQLLPIKNNEHLLNILKLLYLFIDSHIFATQIIKNIK